MSFESVLAEAEQERKHQVNDLGYDAKHDDSYKDYELARAASCYATTAIFGPDEDVPLLWPWDDRFWKPKGHRHNCIRAVALLIAEIERIDRAANNRKN